MSAVAEARARYRQRISKNTHCEIDLAQRWWLLPIGCFLPLHDGQRYQLLFAGYPGGAAGPDVRDAVLARPDGSRIPGDVEFHIRSSDWISHQHHTDPRYNRVILHLVLQCDDTQPTRRQDGYSVPLCSLNDLMLSTRHADRLAAWPCQHVMATRDEQAREKLLVRAGLLRFEQKSSLLVERIRTSVRQNPLSSSEEQYTACLIAALAEGLGYGRDRDFFHAAGLYALKLTTTIPEPLGRSPVPSPLDSTRLRFLRRLVQEWWDSPVHPAGWQQLQSLILHGDLDALRLCFIDRGLSLARTDILFCNVVLPFAVAIALIEGRTILGDRATELYLSHPGLPSNRITRIMARQLGLAREPAGSCQQQGLHHIYQETCKEKACHLCIAGRNVL